MNAHNEQQALPCPFCGREPDLSFNSVSCGCAASPFIDREDALQVWNTRAAQPSPVVKQNLTTQPAAAQEAVAEVLSCRVGNDTSTIDKALPIGTKLHATNVTAAPGIDLDEYDAGILSDFGGGDICWWQDYIRAELARAHEFYQSQIDASPKGELESWKRGTKACAEVLGQVTRQMQDSPKGGSEAISQLLPPNAWPRWADRHVWDANGEGWFYGAIVEGGGEGLAWNYELQPSGIAMPSEHDWRVPVLRTRANSHGAGVCNG